MASMPRRVWLWGSTSHRWQETKTGPVVWQGARITVVTMAGQIGAILAAETTPLKKFRSSKTQKNFILKSHSPMGRWARVIKGEERIQKRSELADHSRSLDYFEIP